MREEDERPLVQSADGSPSASPEVVMTVPNRIGMLGSAASFGVALGTATLVLPLLAIAAGYDPAMVGILTAVSAISHFVLRLGLPWMLGRFADRNLVVVSCVMMASSYALLLVSTALPVFVAAQLFQGGARGLFWTASQTHAVRRSSGTVRSLAQFQATSRVGVLAGPALAGIAAAASLELALALGLLTGAIAAFTALLMKRLPPFQRTRQPGQSRIWRRPSVELACWSSFAAGGWRAMLNSYVPIILTSAGLGPSTVGALLALSDVASLAMVTALIRLTPAHAHRIIQAGVVLSCLCFALVPFVAENQVAVAACLLVVGASSGLQMTLGPAIANDAVSAEERGEAMAVTGTFRAAALLITPAAIAVSLSVVVLPVAVAATAGALALPVVAAGIRSRQTVAKAGV